MAIRARNIQHDSGLRRVVLTGMVPTDPLTVGDSRGHVFCYGLGSEGGTIERVTSTVGTAPTGAAMTVMLANGANDILNSVLSMAASDKTATSTDINTTYEAVADGDVIDIDIDQVGSTEPGEFLLVQVVIKLNQG